MDDTMGVPKFQRNISKAEFVYNAFELYRYAIKECTHWSRKKFDYITRFVLESAYKVFYYTNKGNSLYVKYKWQLQERIDLYNNALAELEVLNSLLFPAYDMLAETTSGKKIDDSSWDQWTDYIDKETALLTALVKEEQDRYDSMSD